MTVIGAASVCCRDATAGGELIVLPDDATADFGAQLDLTCGDHGALGPHGEALRRGFDGDGFDESATVRLAAAVGLRARLHQDDKAGDADQDQQGANAEADNARRQAGFVVRDDGAGHDASLSFASGSSSSAVHVPPSARYS